MRGKPPKGVRGRREASRAAKAQITGRAWRWDWKYWVAFGVAIIALIGLRARPTVSLEPPLDPGNVLSTPVVISNDGILALGDVDIATFVSQVNYTSGSVETGSVAVGYSPPNRTLETGEKETVAFRHFLDMTNAYVSYADVSLIVFFRPAYLPFISRKHSFRFKTVLQSDGTLRFQQQPPGNVLEEYERAKKASKEIHPPGLP
jgi:hypothetical protein